MKLIRKAGATSNIFQIFIQDSSSSTGAGLTGLTNASSGLVAYYHRDTDTTATAISLASMTIGTFTSSGFKLIDDTNMPGWYQFCPPDAAIAAGAKSCAFHLKGATNMAPLPIEVQLVAYDPDDTVRLGLTALPNVASGSAGAIPTTGTGTAQISVSSGQVILQSGTGTGQLDFTSGVVKANLAQILGTALTETAGLLAGGFKKFFNVATPTGTLNSIPDAVAGASGGLLIAGANAGTITFGAFTVTGAFSINGVSNVAQTGDSFARIGAAGASLTAVSLSAAGNNAIADAWTARNVAGGSSTGRTNGEGMAFLRNKWTVALGTLTVYGTDDTTPLWTAAVSTDAAAIPIVGNDPS